MERDTVFCPLCGSPPGTRCDFPGLTPPPVVEDGESRRAVHAARYADTLLPDERSQFWENAVSAYLTQQLAEELSADGRGASRWSV